MEFLVCNVAELEEKKAYTYVVNDVEVGIIRLKEEIYAYENYCLHQGGPLCLGEVAGKVKLELDENQAVVEEYVSEDEICVVCPWHGYEYDVKTGECVGRPKLKLRKMKVNVKEGQLFVEL